MTEKLYTKGEMAKLLGVSISTINNYLTEGMTVAVQGKGGLQTKLDLDEVQKWLKENTKSKNEELFSAKLRKEIATASLAELELERERGLVIPISDVITQVSAEYTSIRAKFLGLASQTCHELAVIIDPKIITQVLDAKVREYLEELTADNIQNIPITPTKKAGKAKKTIDDDSIT